MNAELQRRQQSGRDEHGQLGFDVPISSLMSASLDSMSRFRRLYSINGMAVMTPPTARIWLSRSPTELLMPLFRLRRLQVFSISEGLPLQTCGATACLCR
jgi:hypothetical protein